MHSSTEGATFRILGRRFVVFEAQSRFDDVLEVGDRLRDGVAEGGATSEVTCLRELFGSVEEHNSNLRR